MSSDALSFGPAGGLRFSRNAGRSLTSEALGAIRYPSPFFDIAHTYLPSSFKTMLRWCRYYYLTNPLINAVCTKMAEYPVTDLIFDTENEPLRQQWDRFFSAVLNFKKFEVEAGLDYNCLAGETLVTTKEGVFPIASLAGRTVEVLSANGVYRPAEFRSFGVQDLYEVEFSHGEVLLATEGHEWPVEDTNKRQRKVTTLELKGKYLLRPDYGRKAQVARVEHSGRREEVYCCLEPETHTFTVGNGVLTGNCYGNAFISISFPFQKLLICKSCNHHVRVEKQKYVFREYKFIGECQRCGFHAEFNVRDHYIRSVRDIRLVRWNPEYITVQHNEATGESRYYYSVPPAMSNDIRMSKRHIIERVPQVFIEALRNNKALLFSRDNIYHMKRPTIAQKDKGWGMPMILPVLKDTFYLQVLRKAQEAIAVEHIVPLRLLFPQTSSPEASVYSTVNLTQWRDKIEQEIVRWRLDNNYIPLLPIPVGQQTLGGDGRALMLAQEYRVWSEQIIAGMGVPIEFVYGGMQYSGSNVSMRILENHFLDQKTQRRQLVTDFILPSIGAFMGWEVVPVHYKRFKMADDLQRSALYLQMNQAGKLSDKSLLEDMDWDARKERELIAVEQKMVLENQRSQALAQAGIQGEAQLVQVKYQTRAQKIMMEQQAQPMPPADAAAMQQGGMQAAGQPGAASPAAVGADMNAQTAMANQAGQVPPMDMSAMQEAPGGGAGGEGPAPATQAGESPLQASQEGQGGAQADVLAVAQQVVGWLNQLPEHEKQANLVQMQQNNPQLYSLVLQMLQQTRGSNVNSAAMPLPEQRPPQRGPEGAMV